MTKKAAHGGAANRREKREFHEMEYTILDGFRYVNIAPPHLVSI